MLNPLYFLSSNCRKVARRSIPQAPQQEPKVDDKMVFYFKSNVVDPPAFIYVGKDKVESISHPKNSSINRSQG